MFTIKEKIIIKKQEDFERHIMNLKSQGIQLHIKNTKEVKEVNPLVFKNLEWIWSKNQNPEDFI